MKLGESWNESQNAASSLHRIRELLPAASVSAIRLAALKGVAGYEYGEEKPALPYANKMYSWKHTADAVMGKAVPITKACVRSPCTFIMAAQMRLPTAIKKTISIVQKIAYTISVAHLMSAPSAMRHDDLHMPAPPLMLAARTLASTTSNVSQTFMLRAFKRHEKQPLIVATI